MVAGIAALVVAGASTAWYRAAHTQRQTPSPSAPISKAFDPDASRVSGSGGDRSERADKTAEASVVATPVPEGRGDPSGHAEKAAVTLLAPELAPGPRGDPFGQAGKSAETLVAAALIRPAPLPAAKPINAPLASFMRSNSGWSVTVSFIEPVAAIAWRLGGAGAFKETGFLDFLDPRTRRRLANPSFELDPDQKAATLEVRAVDADGNATGPFPIAFDPDAELRRGERRTLEMTAGSWLSFREFNGSLVYYTHLMSYRCAIREMRIGIGSAVPNKVVPLGDCDPRHPYEIPADARPYLRVPPTTQIVSVELTYRDGSVSETKTFRR